MIFDEAVAKLDEHYVICDKIYDGEFNELGIEARRRILQMHFLVEKIAALSNENTKKMEEFNERMFRNFPNPPDVPEEEQREYLSFSIRTNDEIVLLTESYYWIAGRNRSVIRLLPGLSSFEAAGVRNVRNHLIEHPEKGASGVTHFSFASGGPNGPIVKGCRSDREPDKWQDAGLFTNNREFLEALIKSIPATAEEIIAIEKERQERSKGREGKSTSS